MTDNSRTLPRSAWLGFSLVTGLLGLAVFIALLQHSRAPQTALPVLGPVADFTLTNQDGNVTTLANFTNHVWVADIVFTRCGGPCPRLSRQMESLQEQFSASDPARLVTLTTDPVYDTPAVLKKYGERIGVDFQRWTFLTGTPREIAQLASGSLKLSTQPVQLDKQQNPVDLFIHATLFVVVDKHARLRTYFETGGDGVDWTNDVAPRLLKSVHQLENEP